MITLDNFTDTQKLIFADAFETMTCGNLTLDRQYTTEEEKKFDTEADFGLFKDEPTSYITLKPNEFAIIYPEDAHAPIIGNGKIRKLVVKIKI